MATQREGRPNCHENRYSRTIVGIAQKGGGPETPVCERERHWLLQVVAATSGTIWVDGRMHRPVRLLRRTPGQARRRHVHQVLGMDWRVDATLGGLIIQRADEILNSMFGSSCLGMANIGDLRRAR